MKNLFRNFLLLAILILLLAAPTFDAAAQSGEGRLIVAWVEDGNLLLWREGDASPRSLATGNVTNRPFLSPDGELAAFTRGPDSEISRNESLWMVGAGGEDEFEVLELGGSQEESPQFYQVEWVDEHILLFNTMLLGPVQHQISDDLWRADATTGQATLLFPRGQGGVFSASPNGEVIALVMSGRYGEMQGTIRLVDIQGRLLGEPFYFDAISIGTEYSFYPRVSWLTDSSALRVAIPHPDLLYATDLDQLPPTRLWEIGITGAAEQIGEVSAYLFGLPRWSLDGEWMTYIQRMGEIADNRHQLILAHADGSGPQVIWRGSAGNLNPPTWGEAGYTFTFGAPGEVWYAVPGNEPVRFPSEHEYVYNLMWADEATAVYFYSVIGSPSELRYVTLENRIPTTIAEMEMVRVFDAVRAP